MSVCDVLGSKDKGVRSLLVLIISLLLVFWGTIVFDCLGFSIPILRQFTGFLLLTFVPGILILRILQIHNLDAVETLVYAVGISLSTLMFTGFFMNLAFPFFGIIRPLSLWPLAATVSILVIVLSFLTWVRDQNSTVSWITLREVLSPQVLVLSLLPLGAVFGTYLVNFYNINSLLMILLLIISLVPVVVACSWLIPEKYYSYAVISIAIALLYHRSLISMYLWGWDIHVENYLTNIVIQNGFWDFTTSGNCNAMLSIEMLAPIYSNLCSMSITWVFKIIYPLLFALVPLGLYSVFQKQTNDKVAFLSCFFFMSIFTFYTEMLALARQEIAELFLVLLILLMINKNLDRTKRSFLFIVFGISLAVSHYGLSYIYIFCLISAWLILVLGENQTIQKMMSGIYSEFGSKTKGAAGNPVQLKVDRSISSIFVLIFITFTIAWYIYVSSSSTFITIVQIGGQIAGSIFTEFLNPEAAQGLDVILKKTSSPLHSLTKCFYLLAQIFILVGVAKMMLRRKEMKFEREYEAFVLLNLAICIASIALPYFASSLNVTRLFQITLIFLAPFCVIGGVKVFKTSSKIVETAWIAQYARHPLKIMSIFLAIFLLLNSGWIYEVSKDNPSSTSLSQNFVKEHGDAETKAGFYSGYDPEQNIVSLNWISSTCNKEEIMVYAGKAHPPQICGYGMIPLEHVRELSNATNNIDAGAYVYLGYLNIVEGIVISWETKFLKETLYYNTAQIFPLLNIINKIYTNGGSEIYYEGEK